MNKTLIVLCTILFAEHLSGGEKLLSGQGIIYSSLIRKSRAPRVKCEAEIHTACVRFFNRWSTIVFQDGRVKKLLRELMRLSGESRAADSESVGEIQNLSIRNLAADGKEFPDY